MKELSQKLKFVLLDEESDESSFDFLVQGKDHSKFFFFLN